MTARLLPPHRPLPVHWTPSAPAPTHLVRLCCYRKSDICDVVGVVTVDMDDPRSVRRSARIEALVRYRCAGLRVQAQLVPLDELRQRSVLSDLERFRRKMLRVQRAYESDRKDIESGASGLFQTERLRELDALLEQAWQKMEARYRCRREDLADESLRAKTEALRAAGRLHESDHYETAGS